LVDLQVGMGAVQIDGEGELRDVAVVDPEAFDAAPPCPLAPVPRVLRQPVGKILESHRGVRGDARCWTARCPRTPAPCRADGATAAARPAAVRRAESRIPA